MFANSLHLKEVSGPSGTDIGKSVMFNLNNIAESKRSIIFVDWGDNQTSAQSTTPSHEYATSGRYHATLVVIEKGQLYHDEHDFNVLLDKSPTTISIDVPTPPPADDNFINTNPEAKPPRFIVPEFPAISSLVLVIAMFAIITFIIVSKNGYRSNLV